MLSQNTSSSAELLWRPIRRGRDVSSDSSLDPLTSDSVSLLRLASMVGASSTYPQSIQITGQLFPRKLVPKISSRYTRDRERNSQKEMACRDSCFYTLCYQCLTGSWLGRPSCSCFLSECLHTHTHVICEGVRAFMMPSSTSSPVSRVLSESSTFLECHTLCGEDVSARWLREKGCHGVPSPPAPGRGG